MTKIFTLDYWTDDGWLVGKLREVPGVFSQGKTLEELKVNIQDAYHLLMMEQTPILTPDLQTIELPLEVS